MFMFLGLGNDVILQLGSANSNVAIGHSWHKKKHTVKKTIHIADENCKKTHDLEDDKLPL